MSITIMGQLTMETTRDATIKAWQCVGCGRVEAPQPCIGICQDRAVELVPEEAYRTVSQECARLREENAAWRELVLRLAGTNPRGGQWEAGYKALQKQARKLLESHANTRAGSSTP